MTVYKCIRVRNLRQLGVRKKGKKKNPERDRKKKTPKNHCSVLTQIQSKAEQDHTHIFHLKRSKENVGLISEWQTYEKKSRGRANRINIRF